MSRKIRKKTEHDKALEAFTTLQEYCLNHAKNLCEECVFRNGDYCNECGMVAGLEDAEDFDAILVEAKKKAGELANATD